MNSSTDRVTPVLKHVTLEAFRERARGARALKPLFEPASIAIVGATPREGSVGYAVFRNLLLNSFRGTLYPVNPKYPSILGVKCYQSLAAIDDPIELVIVIIPPAHIPALLKEAIRKDIHTAIIISAGFKEVGQEGAELEKNVLQIAAEGGISLLGPNCLGVINTDPEVSMNASFARRMALPGNIAFMSQSGALCTSILDYALGNNIGFSKFISFGNKADINENDLLRYLGDDPRTGVILIYIEDMTDGPAFMHIAREITENKGKPVLAIKTGRTPEGASAAASHTGSLAGTDEVYDAVFQQAGVRRVETVQELFDLAMAFSSQQMPRSDRIAIVTNAGGPGIMATDACIRYGLSLARFSDTTQQALKRALPSSANFNNPVDVIGDARHDRYEAALRAVLEDDDTGSAMVILTPQNMTDIEEIAAVIARVANASEKPVVASFMGHLDVSPGIAILRRQGVPHYSFPEDAARVLSAMWRYRRWLDRPRATERVFEVNRRGVQETFERTLRDGRTQLPDYEALAVLRDYGFPVKMPLPAADEAELEAVCGKLSFPVVMKIASPQILHKTDVGGVAVNLRTLDEARTAMRAMIERAREKVPQAKILGVTVQEMAARGREVILGSTRDPKFGPLIMFGLGGIYTEALRDVTFRLAPMRKLSARNMLEEIRAKKILGHFRGDPPVDIETLQECLERLSQLVVEFPIIKELDINPLIAYPDGAVAVDARIILDPDFNP